MKEVENVAEERIGLLMNIKEVFDKNNIFFFPIYGTLLGFIREKGIIPFDTDLDIGVFVNDWKKVVNTFDEFNTKYNYGSQFRLANQKYTRLRIFIKPEGASKENSNKIFGDMVSIKKGSTGLNSVPAAGIWFFDMDHKSNELYLFEHVCYRTRFPFKGFTSTKIYGGNFNIFVNAEEILELTYGKDWRKPIPGWTHPRVCDHYFYKRNWFSRFIIDRWIWFRNYKQMGKGNFLKRRNLDLQSSEEK